MMPQLSLSKDSDVLENHGLNLISYAEGFRISQGNI